MNWKRISIWIICIIVIGGFIGTGFKSWMKNSLPSFINEKNDTPYNFNYSDVSYSLFKRQMIISDISITPKIKNKGIYTIKTKKIIIHGVHFIRFLSEKNLIADLIEIDHPSIIINQIFDSINTKKEIKSYDIGNSIQIGDFVLNKGSLQLFNSKTKQKIASLKNLDLHLSGVVWDVADKEKRIPISYQTAKFSVEDLFYQLNEIHHLSLTKIKFDNGYIEADQVFLKPDVTEKQFFEGNYIQKSFMDIRIPITKIKNLNWGYGTNGLFYVNIAKIEVDSTNIRILGKPNMHTSKTVTSYIDRIIPFNLKIDSIQISKSKLNLNNHVVSNNINITIKKIKNKVDDKITIDQLKLYDNFVSIYQQKPSPDQNKSNFIYFFDDLLEIKNFSIENCNINYFNTNKVNVLNMRHINYNLNDIVINTLITNTKKELPFTYTTYNLNANNLSYTALKDYSFKIASINLTNDAFSANKLEITPKISRILFANQKLGNNLFKININKLSIPKINWKIENEKFTIQAPSLRINAMIADLYQNKNAKSQSKKLYFNNSELGVDITVDAFVVTNSSINQYDASSGLTLTSTKDLNITVNHITLNDNSKNTTLGLPFSFSKLVMTGGNVFHDMGYHTLQLDDFRFTNTSLTASNLTVKPKENRKENMRKKGIDAYHINLAKIEIPNLNLGLPNQEIQLSAPHINIYKMATTIHQYDIPDSDYIPVYKPLFSKKLRDLKFKLQVGQVNLKNSYLSYEEESLDKGTGKIYFTNINAQIKNLNSGYKVSSLPDVQVNFSSNFMHSAKLSALWKFNVLSSTDKFTIKGEISTLPAEKINQFIKPYLQVSADGMIDEVTFDFMGNNDKGNGTFGMNYKDLKVVLYKKNGKEEKKLLSSLANLAVKGNTQDSLKTSKIKEVERIKDKSFFNFLWKMTLSGLKVVLLKF